MAERVVTLTNQLIINLFKRADVKKTFPRIKSIAKAMGKSSNCNCSSQKARARNRAVNDFKTMLKNWSQSNKNTLKKLIGADRVRVYIGKKMIEF